MVALASDWLVIKYNSITALLTKGVDFNVKTVTIDEDTTVKLQIWYTMRNAVKIHHNKLYFVGTLQVKKDSHPSVKEINALKPLSNNVIQIKGQLYYTGAHAVIITYDITNKTTFGNIDKWRERVEERNEENKDDIINVLVGCKADLEHQREVKRKLWVSS